MIENMASQGIPMGQKDYLIITSKSGNFPLIASSMHLLSQLLHGPPQNITAVLSLSSINSAQLLCLVKTHCKLSIISLTLSSVAFSGDVFSMKNIFYHEAEAAVVESIKRFVIAQ